MLAGSCAGWVSHPTMEKRYEFSPNILLHAPSRFEGNDFHVGGCHGAWSSGRFSSQKYFRFCSRTNNCATSKWPCCNGEGAM